MRLLLTTLGASKLLALSAAHLGEVSRLGPSLKSLWRQLPQTSTPPPGVAHLGGATGQVLLHRRRTTMTPAR